MVIKRIQQSQISLGYCDPITGQRVYPPPPIDPMADLLPEQLPPQQEEASSTTIREDDGMAVTITCTPPLGQATTVGEVDAVNFTVLLQVSDPSESITVSLWHNHNGDWTDTPLQKVDDKAIPLYGEQSLDAATQHWFTASLSGLPKHGHAVSFTLKYRIGSSPWRWIKDTTGTQDGSLHYLASAEFLKHCSSYDLSHFVHGISNDITTKPVQAETSKTQLWHLICPVKPAHGQDSGYSHHRLGKVKKTERWFSLVRLWSPWLAPRQGGKRFELDKEGILAAFQRSDGLHVVCLAISGIKDVLTTFFNDDEGNIEIKGRNDREEAGASEVLVAVAEDFERANAAVMYEARNLVRGYEAENHSPAERDTDTAITTLMDDVKPESLEEFYDGLTYCTWNGLGQNLTASLVYNAVATLAENEIHISGLIVDDNWQSLNSQGASQFQRGWSRFEANSVGFPDGLKGMTEYLRDHHPGLKYIAVWHALLGYWGGIDPDGEIAAKYKTRVVEKEPGVAGGSFTVVDPSDVYRLYDDCYRFLASCGIDGVKTDAQFFLDLLLHAPDRRAMMQQYQNAWTIAHLRHFSGRAISCMSQIPQALFTTQLLQNKPRILARSSDDFFPAVPASHPWHIFCNAHNTIFLQHLQILPDFDMFQTAHEWAGFHAAARCVSGGPVYITDVPGQHDINLIRQITAQTIQRKTVILRPHRVGKTMEVYTPYDAQALLRVGNYVGMQTTGSGILACFNVTKSTIRQFVGIAEFPGTENGDYVIGSFRSPHSFSSPASASAEEVKGSVHLSLEPKGWDILTAYPLQTVKIKDEMRATKVAILGLVGKMTGIAAVTSSKIHVDETNGRLRVWTELKALGTLGVWISDLASRSVEDNFMVMIYGRPVPVSCVKMVLAGGEKGDGVLEVDVQRAWEEMGLKPGWGNEVTVEVFVG